LDNFWIPVNEIEKHISEVRKKYGVTVLAIQRGALTITNPSGDTQLEAQDIVILIGTRECIAGVTSHTSSNKWLDDDSLVQHNNLK
jgi:K+/H+ antiporter YhaU regulatory subunit KhtT